MNQNISKYRIKIILDVHLRDEAVYSFLVKDRKFNKFCGSSSCKEYFEVSDSKVHLIYDILICEFRSLHPNSPNSDFDIFSFAGYDGAITLKELEARDLIDLQNFAKTIPDLISTYCKDRRITLDDNQTNGIRRLFLGLYASDASKFQFHKGEAVLILQVSNFVKRKVTRENGEDNFSFFSNNDCEEKQSSTTKTHVGVLFGEEVCETKKKRRGIQQAEKKSRIQCLEKGRINFTSANESDNLTADVIVNEDLASITKVLIECCSKQVKRFLAVHCNANIEETNFMTKCGIESLEDFTLNVSLSEINLKNLPEMKTNNNIAASIMCYCRKQNATAAVYFRGKNNWMDTIKSAVNHSHAVNELQTCWSINNFKRHIISHKKFYTSERLEDFALNNNEPEDATLKMTEQAEDIVLNTSAEDNIQKSFEQLIDDNYLNVENITEATAKSSVRISFYRTAYAQQMNAYWN